MPRKVVCSLFMALNGVASDPYTFQFDSFDDELGAHMTEGIGRASDVLLGRVTYTEWAAHFPTSDDPFAAFINPAPKHVASRTLSQGDLTWENSRLIDGDLLDFVRELKQGEGGDIAVNGSLSVVRQLVAAGELDAMTLIIHPAIAGEGRALFEGMATTRLELLDLKRTPKGNAIVTYGPKAD